MDENKIRGEHLTDIEELMYNALLTAKLQVNLFYPIRNKYDYQPDICIPSAKLIIECDGEVWHQNKKHDRNRDLFFNKLGWKTLRFTGDQINNQIENCIYQIRRNLNGTTATNIGRN